jgi:ElaB/YqjD/DUF883 family membrane-anchored ribosome-binding protein
MPPAAAFIGGRSSVSAKRSSEDVMTYQEQREVIKNKVVGVVNDVADHVSNVADKANRETAGARRDIANTASDLANRATHALSDAGVDTESIGKALSSSLDALAKSVRTMVRDRPLGALAVTAAIGLILGAMANR